MEHDIPVANTILLVEDSPSDAAILIAAFEGTSYSGNIRVAESGLDAIHLLEKLGTTQHAEWPQLILIDLNLPTKDGLEILDVIKTNPDWMKTPAVVLSSSSSPSDIDKSYRKHANAYISKPRQLKHYEAVARSLCTFWFDVAQPSSV